MKLRHGVTAIAVIAATALALTACSSTSKSSSSPSQTAHGGTLTIGMAADVESFDPALVHQGSYTPYDQPTYDSLIRRLPTGKYAPMLATKWSYNSDQSALTLTLRKGVKFSDGTPVNAAAVKENIQRFRDDKGPDSANLAQVSTVTTPNTHTVVLNLSAPNPALLDYLANSSSFIASPKAIAGGKIATDPVGSGPYTYDAADSVAGSTYTFDKRSGYWDPALQVYSKIVFKVITDPSAMLNAMASGQINAGLLSGKTEAQAKSSGLTEYLYPADIQGIMFFDRDGKLVPALKDVRVRQAINYAIDKATLLKQLNGGHGTVTAQSFAASSTAYVPSLDKAYPYDPAKAKQLLAEAGVTNLQLTFPNAPEVMDPAMEAAVQQDLKNVGITLTWQTTTQPDFQEGMFAGKYPAVWSFTGQNSTWFSIGYLISQNATYNPFHTTDPKVNAWIQTIQHDPSKATAAAQALNKYIVQQAWFAPFYRYDQVYFSDAKTKVTPSVNQILPSIYYYAPKK